MNKKNKAILRGVAAGAGFAIAMGDVIDNFASAENHPAWYTHYPIDNLVTLNFGERENLASDLVNHKLGYANCAADGTRSEPVYFMTPTDAMIEVRLAIPKANGQDVADKAAALLLQQIRSVATTTAPYQKADARRVLLNVRSIVALYAELRRCSGEFEITDAYDADAYHKYVQMGLGAKFRYEEIAAGIAQFRAELGAITPLIRNLIPVNIDLIERTKWMFSNVFADSPSAKFSSKQFTTTSFPVWTDDGVKHVFRFGSQINAVKGTGTEEDPFYTVSTDAQLHECPTFAGLPQLLRSMISMVTNQNMTSRVLGDILKAFGQDAFMDIPPFEPHARTRFVYDEDILQQIQNLTITGWTEDYLDSDFQGTMGMASDASRVPVAALDLHLVNTYRDSVSAGKLLSLTRLSAFAAEGSVSRHTTGGTTPVVAWRTWELSTVGTEAVVSYSWLHYVTNSTQLNLITPFVNGYVSAGTITARWSSDDYAPMCIAQLTTDRYVVFDAQNWALMNEKDLATYTEYATLSLCMIHELVKKSDTFVFVQ